MLRRPFQQASFLVSSNDDYVGRHSLPDYPNFPCVANASVVILCDPGWRRQLVRYDARNVVCQLRRSHPLYHGPMQDADLMPSDALSSKENRRWLESIAQIVIFYSIGSYFVEAELTEAQLHPRRHRLLAMERTR